MVGGPIKIFVVWNKTECDVGHVLACAMVLLMPTVTLIVPRRRKGADVKGYVYCRAAARDEA